MNTPTQPKTITAQNMLSDQKSYLTLNFAIVGDPETDAISGVLAVMERCGLHAREAVRLLEYVKQRFAAQPSAQPFDLGEIAAMAAQRIAQQALLPPPGTIAPGSPYQSNPHGYTSVGPWP